jgi:hypothetical protein
VGAQTFTVMAEELAGRARAELWPELVARAPSPAGADNLTYFRTSQVNWL